MKYLSKLNDIEITEILNTCFLRPITFKNVPAIKKTNTHILVSCIKMDSMLYKTIIEWNNKQNDNGDLMLSYFEKSDFDNFILLAMSDFEIKVINNTNNVSLANENNKLSIKLNLNFLSTMLSKFANTNYNFELKQHNLYLPNKIM